MIGMMEHHPLPKLAAPCPHPNPLPPLTAMLVRKLGNDIPDRRFCNGLAERERGERLRRPMRVSGVARVATTPKLIIEEVPSTFANFSSLAQRVRENARGAR